MAEINLKTMDYRLWAMASYNENNSRIKITTPAGVAPVNGYGFQDCTKRGR